MVYCMFAFCKSLFSIVLLLCFIFVILFGLYLCVVMHFCIYCLLLLLIVMRLSHCLLCL